MSKKQLLLIVILCIMLSWLFELFFGRALAAKLSTLPVLNRFHILSPQAPIVITNRETVRETDQAAAISAAGVKSKLSLVVWVNNSSAQVTGGALNITSDGTFLAPAGTFTQNGGSYYVQLEDGRNAKITTEVSDPATSVVFFKADLNNVPVVNFSDSSAIVPGNQLALVLNSLENFNNKISLTGVSAAQNDIAGQVFQSDYPRRVFSLSEVPALTLGEAVSDSDGNIAGIWNGSNLISADVLKQTTALYLNNNQIINRPSFGFSYQIIGPSESILSGQSQGAEVKSVAVNSAAHQAGLEVNDIIISIDNKLITVSSPLEPLLQNYKPGDVLNLSVMRGKSATNLKLTVGVLK